MNIKCSVYVGASVDGFIARPDGDLEWLHRAEYSTSEKGGLSYETFISTVDALVMGRNTFEKVLTFKEWPYEQTPVVVLSTRALGVPERLRGKVRVESCPPTELVARLASEGAKHLYIDGGVTIQRFLQARLIDEITVTHIPILLGAGISLFGSTAIELPLRLLESTAFSNGFVQVRYKVQDAAQQQVPADGPRAAPSARG
jgi:dihydrofolate reductase